MNIQELQALYVNNIERMFIPENFKELASHSSDIQGYSFMNRLLIYIQNKFCTEVKSRLSWELIGREIKEEAVALGILTPITKTRYIENETQREVKASELNAAEFNKAILLGIVTKEIEVTDIKCALVYDIRDTIEIEGYNKAKVKVDRRIKLSTLLELLTSIGISVDKADSLDTTFDIDSNTILIGEDNLSNKIEKCIDTLVIKYIEQCLIDINLTEHEIRLIREYAVYSTLTYFNIATSITFDYIHSIYEEYNGAGERIECLIGILDDIEHMLSSNVLNSCGDPSGYAVDEGHKTYIAHKASILLAILEANYGANEFEGV